MQVYVSFDFPATCCICLVMVFCRISDLVMIFLRCLDVMLIVSQLEFPTMLINVSVMMLWFWHINPSLPFLLRPCMCC